MLALECRTLQERERVDDTFAHDLGRVDVFESHVRFVLFCEEFGHEGAAPMRIVGRGHKIIMPKRVIIPAIGRVLFALGYSAMPDILDLSRMMH